MLPPFKSAIGMLWRAKRFVYRDIADGNMKISEFLSRPTSVDLFLTVRSVGEL